MSLLDKRSGLISLIANVIPDASEVRTEIAKAVFADYKPMALGRKFDFALVNEPGKPAEEESKG